MLIKTDAGGSADVGVLNTEIATSCSGCQLHVRHLEDSFTGCTCGHLASFVNRGDFDGWCGECLGLCEGGSKSSLERERSRETHMERIIEGWENMGGSGCLIEWKIPESRHPQSHDATCGAPKMNVRHMTTDKVKSNVRLSDHFCKDDIVEILVDCSTERERILIGVPGRANDQTHRYSTPLQRFCIEYNRVLYGSS